MGVSISGPAQRQSEDDGVLEHHKDEANHLSTRAIMVTNKQGVLVVFDPHCTDGTMGSQVQLKFVN